MDLTLLSGVVRNRKMASAPSRNPAMFSGASSEQNSPTPFTTSATSTTTSSSSATSSTPSYGLLGRLFGLICRNNFCRKFSLRVHKFAFQWDLCLHLSICILSLAIPFLYTGDRRFGVIPIVIWMLYHVWFILLLPRQGSSVSVGSNAPLPNTNNPLLNGDGIFARMYNNLYNRWNRNLYGNNSNLSSASSQQYHSTLKSTIEDFFSPKLLPILSVSYLLVALSLAVTGHRLGGPPLCYSSCDVCLSQWQYSIPLALEGQAASLDAIPAKDANGYDVYTEPFRHGCGYANGKELLAYYTMANTSFLLFFTVVVAMAVCLAWKVAEEEKLDRLQAEEWLRTESAEGFDMRARLIKLYGSPASPIRPEGSFTWVSFGVIAAITFTLLGWHNWYVLPPSHTATLLIILNLFTIIASMLILHLGFFGRILALYKRNLSRVEFLTQLLNQCTEQDLDSWWNCRNFVLNDDLSLDYDIGGLAVSATFLINVFVFLILMSQIFKEGNGGHLAMLEPPGSYCAYGCMYITCCLIKIFTLATNTYEEQHRHIAALQMMSASLVLRYGNLVDSPLNNVSSSLPPPPHPGSSNNPMAVNHPMNRYNPNFVNSNGSMDEYDGDGPLYMDSPISKHHYSSYHTRFPSDGHFDPLIHGQRNFGIAMQPASRSRDEEDDDLRDYDMKSLDEMDSAMPAISSNSPKGKTQKDTFFLEDFPPIETSSFMLQHSNSNANISSVNNNNLNHTATSNNMPPAITATNSKPGVIDNLLKKSFFGNPSEVANNTDIEGLPIDDERPPSRPLSRSGSHNLLRSRSKSNQENESECREDLESNLHPTSDETAPLLEVPKVESSCRMTSVNVENFRQTIAELISQIRKYDPYPCILGIPIMPALFTTSKYYIFISFVLIGTRTMISAFRQL